MQRPGPRDGAEAELEAAGPVDPEEWRVRGEPARELLDDAAAVPGIARQPRRANELQPVMMSIQIPDDLVIADRGIEVGHISPEDDGRAPVVHGIEMPVNLASARSERQSSIAEYVVLPREDAVGALDRIRRG